MNNCKKIVNSGFTLIELSISILIISLLVAGVTAGSRLVQNAKLQNVIREFQTYDVATKSFKDKFHYYPGDFPTAATYWSATNGNGNWQIDFTTAEQPQFWKQLGLAGFIPNSYTGTGAPAFNIGSNLPASTLTPGGYTAQYSSSIYATAGNFIQFTSKIGNDPTGVMNGQIVNAQDAYAIDIKIDDGLASSGNIYTTRSWINNGLTTCTSATYTTASGTYRLSDTAITCRMFYWLDKNK